MSVRIKILLSGLVGLVIGASISFYATSKFLGEFMEYHFLSLKGSDSIMLVHALNRIQDENTEDAVETLEQELGMNMISVSYGMQEYPEGIKSVDKLIPMIRAYWNEHPYDYGDEEIQQRVDAYVKSK